MIYELVQAARRVCDIFHEPSHSCTFPRSPVNYPEVNFLRTCKKRRETFCVPDTGLFRAAARSVKTPHGSVPSANSASALPRAPAPLMPTFSIPHC